MEQKNNLAYLLHKELLKTAEKFAKKCPKADAEVILGAGNMYITGFLVNAPTKDAAKDTLESCIEVTPDSYFGGGISRNFNPN